MRLTFKIDNGYQGRMDNPETSIEQDICAIVQKLGRIEDIADELGTFLIYLDCCRMGAENTLEGEGYVAVRNMLKQYPQFRNIKAEVKKFLDILEADV